MGKTRNPESAFLATTTYHVAEEKKNAFQQAWSDAARLAQRQPGYEWTRTYKAIDWEDSPFQYISFRMWSHGDSYRRLETYDATWKELMARMSNTCTSQESAVYKIIVDDS